MDTILEYYNALSPRSQLLVIMRAVAIERGFPTLDIGVASNVPAQQARPRTMENFTDAQAKATVLHREDPEAFERLFQVLPSA